MIFSSVFFLFAFLPCCLAGYYFIFRNNRKSQNRFLLSCSLLFYAWGGVQYLLLMIGSIVMNWLFALLIQKNKARRILLVADITLNLSLLFVFKYLDFAITCFNGVTKLGLQTLNIALPIGISFFTFQAMSYVIDVYRGNGKALTNILDVGLYISLFPQLVAGPIVRYTDIADQIENRTETYDKFFDGICTFCIGLVKKVILANNVAIIADKAFAADERSMALAWLGAIAYSLQIYFDFSGYSDMAIGLGKMFGFKFVENFNYPYISSSITEFWRRWHISMGTWFRDYVYFPLGGSRVKSKLRLVINLLIVWFLTGLWHGANWTFIFWGLLQFVFLASEKLTGINKKDKTGISSILSHIYTLAVVMVGWIFFKSDTISAALQYVANLFGYGVAGLESNTVYLLQDSWIVLVLAIIFSCPVRPFVEGKITNEKIGNILKGSVSIVLFAVSVVYIAKGSYNPFIYFNF